jgi:hypothetical protein
MNAKRVELLQQMLETELAELRFIKQYLNAPVIRNCVKSGRNIFSRPRTVWRL